MRTGSGERRVRGLPVPRHGHPGYALGYVAGLEGRRRRQGPRAIKAFGARIHQASKAIIEGLEKQAELAAPSPRGDRAEPEMDAQRRAERG